MELADISALINYDVFLLLAENESEPSVLDRDYHHLCILLLQQPELWFRV